MTIAFTVSIDQQLPADSPLSLAQCLQIQKQITTNGELAQMILDGAGHAQIVVSIPDGQPEIDEIFKASIMSLPRETKVRDMMQMGIFTTYYQAIGRKRGAILVGALISCSRQGYSTLADLYEADRSLLMATRNVGVKRINLLTWLFDLK